jgi:hypothetical protein
LTTLAGSLAVLLNFFENEVGRIGMLYCRKYIRVLSFFISINISSLLHNTKMFDICFGPAGRSRRDVSKTSNLRYKLPVTGPPWPALKLHLKSDGLDSSSASGEPIGTTYLGNPGNRQ